MYIFLIMLYCIYHDHLSSRFIFIIFYLAYFLILHHQEDQVNRVRTSNTEKFQQINKDIQEKLELAQTRREQIEREQLEKLRNHVCYVLFTFLTEFSCFLFIIHLDFLLKFYPFIASVTIRIKIKSFDSRCLKSFNNSIFKYSIF